MSTDRDPGELRARGDGEPAGSEPRAAGDTAPRSERDPVADNAAGDDSRDPLDLLAEQFLLRVRQREAVTAESFAAQHPAHADDLRVLLPTLLVLEQAKRDRQSSGSGSRRASVPKLERLGEFRIVREVGRGGMGVVFEAMQESLGRRVALKVLPQASLLGSNQLERFRREAQVAANLHHTHIVPVFGSSEADGYHYYAMQFIDGQGLDVVVRQARAGKATMLPAALPARAAAVARIGVQVADALHHAHLQGTLHRDIKPANLLLETGGHVWVTDFGLAKALQQEGLTVSGDVLGTLPYMAPEQFDGVYDARSEVYALGLVLYELLSLRPAFASDTRSEVIDKIRAGRCDSVRKLGSGLPADLATIVERAMALEPNARYATAAALAEDLRAWLEDRPITARPQTTTERLMRWCRRNRSLASAVGVAAAAVVVAAVVGWGAYLVTDNALDRAENSARDAKLAGARAEGNLLLALEAFEDVFDALVGPDPLHALIDDGDDGDDQGGVVALRAPVDPGDVALLQRMLQFYDRFATQNAQSANLREQTARAYRRVGGIQARLGELDAALIAFQKSAQLYRDVQSRDVTPDLAALCQETGKVLLRRGRGEQAQQSFRQSLKLLEDDAADHSRGSRWLAAHGHYLLAASLMDRLQMARRGRGGPPGGAAGAGQPPPGPATGAPAGPPPGSGPSGRRGGPRPEQRQQALVHLTAARDLLAGLLKEQPEDREYRFLQARVLLLEPPGRPDGRRDGRTDRTEPRPDRPERPDPRAEAIALLERLVAEDEGNDVFRFELCKELLDPRGRPGGTAEDLLRQALDHATQLVKHQPAHPEYLAILGRCRSMWGTQLWRNGDRAAGERELRAALEIELPLAKQNGQQQPRFLEQAVGTYRSLAGVLLAGGRRDEAKLAFAGMLDQLELLVRHGRLVDRLLEPRPGEPRPGEPRRDGDERRSTLLEQLDNVGLGDRVKTLRAMLEQRDR